MPYIDDERKLFIDPALEELITLFEHADKDDGRFFTAVAGDLNYIITRLILAYWKGRHSYQAGAEISGAVHDAYNEFYRRVMVPYEKKKCKKNGDVYAYLDKGKNTNSKIVR